MVMALGKVLLCRSVCVVPAAHLQGVICEAVVQICEVVQNGFSSCTSV